MDTISFSQYGCQPKTLLVAIEGIDGVGKTKAAERLATTIGAVYYKSPGGPFSDMRKHVDRSIDPLCRYFFYRSAVQYDSAAIKSLLCRQSVVCDRYIDSTEVCHEALDPKIADVFNRTGLVLPDYVFVLTAEEAVRQSRNAGRKDLNFFDRNGEFQRASDQRFKQLGYPVIDTTSLTVEEVVSRMVQYLRSSEGEV